MVQTYSNVVGRFVPHLYILGLPYLFDDYAHAEKVLEGPVGRKLLGQFRGLPVRGLAFTYSGGFGFYASDRELRTPESLKGLRMEVMRTRISDWIATKLDFENLSNPPEAFVPLAEKGLVDGLESTYSCFAGYGDDTYAKIITDTGHFLLMTMIVINGAFLDALPEPYRLIVETAARETARKERRDKIALNSSLRTQLERRGVKVVDLTPAEKENFKKTLSAIYASPYAAEDHRKDLIRRIRVAGAAPGAAR